MRKRLLPQVARALHIQEQAVGFRIQLVPVEFHTEAAMAAAETGKLGVMVVVDCGKLVVVVEKHIQVVEVEMGMEVVNMVLEKVMVVVGNVLHMVVEKEVVVVVLYKVVEMVVVNGQGEEENKWPEEAVVVINRDKEMAAEVSEEVAEVNEVVVEMSNEVAVVVSCKSME